MPHYIGGIIMDTGLTLSIEVNRRTVVPY